MGRRVFWVVPVLLALVFAPAWATAQAPHFVMRHAQALLRDACKLHSQMEAAGADGYAMRPVCRFESSVELLIAKLECPRSVSEVPYVLDDCVLWYRRTVVAVRHDCRLDADRGIAATIDCAGRQLESLSGAIARYLRDCRGGHQAQRPDWYAPRAGQPSLPLPGGAGWGNSGHPGSIPIGRSPSFPFGTEGYGAPGFQIPVPVPNVPGFGAGNRRSSRDFDDRNPEFDRDLRRELTVDRPSPFGTSSPRISFGPFGF